jgi:DNA-binding transcriptional LysR family regulator
LVLILPTGHPLAARTEITAGDLVGEKVIVREPDSGTRRIVVAGFVVVLAIGFALSKVKVFAKERVTENA